MLFSLSSLDRMGGTVPQLVLLVAGALGILSFAAFFYLIDYAGRLLRPITVLRRVAEAGLQVIDSVYPEPVRAPSPPVTAGMRGRPGRVILHQGKSEIVLALRLPLLLEEAERMNGVIEFVPQVGDFVASDEPLFQLYGDAREVDVRRLRAAVAFGPERTLEQDPTFAFRIVIDIGLRALSPAINDPTTAVLCLDQLHRLLRAVGNRNLGTDELLGPASREVRVIWRTPNWEGFVDLAFSEIRHYGADNLQVVRRLRALLDNLLDIPARGIAPAALIARAGDREALLLPRRGRARTHCRYSGSWRTRARGVNRGAAAEADLSDEVYRSPQLSDRLMSPGMPPGQSAI
jgi:uncharacterized membrane protein